MDMKDLWHSLWNPPTDGPQATIVLRVMAGSVFLWEGIMKYVFPNLGVGRFTKLGFPMPGVTAGFAAWVEIIGGICLIVGWMTRPVAIAFIIEMLVAMLSTKIPMFLGTYPLALPPAPPQTGLWAVLHEIRSEYAQLTVSLFLLLEGPGPLSLDARAAKPILTGRNAMAVAVSLIVLLAAGPVHAAMSMAEPMPATPASDPSVQAVQALKNKDYKTAGALLRSALKTHPQDPELLNNLAFSERKQGHLDEAFEYYEQALKIKPRFPKAREYLGEAHLQAALAELHTLKNYGRDGEDESKELIEELKESVNKL